MERRETTQIGFLIFPGFPMSCLTSMIEPLRAANEILGETVFAWKLISESGDRVVASAKVAFEPDWSLADAEGLSHIFLLSEPLGLLRQTRSSTAVLRTLDRHGTIVGGVSGGVFPLVRTGLMAGRQCSVHWCYEAAFAAEFPEMPASDAVIVSDRRRVTISGAAAAFEFSTQLIEEKLGAEIATEVACWFQHPLVRGEGVRQSIPTGNSTNTGDTLPAVVARGVAMFADHIEHPISVAEVADALGVSAKQLERMFKRATGQSPKQYYRTLRMKAARQLVIYSKDSMAQIAGAVGYSSSGPMLAHYRATFGVSAQDERKRINLYRVEQNMSVPSM